MVRLINKGWKSSVLHKTKGKLGVIEIPSMPVLSDYVNRHRAYMNVFNAMVTRTVKRKEMLSTPAAMKAMDDEWDKLSKQMAWDLITVREQDDVAAKARYNNIKVHFDGIFGICGAKGSESKRTVPPKSGKADSYSAEVMSKMNTRTLQSLMGYLHPRQRSKHPKQ